MWSRHQLPLSKMHQYISINLYYIDTEIDFLALVNNERKLNNATIWVICWIWSSLSHLCIKIKVDVFTFSTLTEFQLLTDCGIPRDASVQILRHGVERNVWLWGTSICILYYGRWVTVYLLLYKKNSIALFCPTHLTVWPTRVFFFEILINTF